MQRRNASPRNLSETPPASSTETDRLLINKTNHGGYNDLARDGKGQA